MSSVHTCLGTPTLGPALPVDIREPLGGILTLIVEQAQQRWQVEVSRLRAEAAMCYVLDSRGESTVAVVW